VLHVMDKDGGSIRQISFNQSHDFDAFVLTNGQLVLSRWDGAAGNDHVDLYRLNPDGSGLELLYGKQDKTTRNRTHAPPGCAGNIEQQQCDSISFAAPPARRSSFSRLLARNRAALETLKEISSRPRIAGDLVAIDTSNYVENTQPTLPNVGTLAGPLSLECLRRSSTPIRLLAGRSLSFRLSVCRTAPID